MRVGDAGGIKPSVVDDATYDLLQALTSKLEAIEAYDSYVHDDEGTLFTELLIDVRRGRRPAGAVRRARDATRQTSPARSRTRLPLHPNVRPTSARASP